jgi:hypothetical protein
MGWRDEAYLDDLAAKLGAGSWDKRAGVSPPVAGLMNIAPKRSRIHKGWLAMPDPRTALRGVESKLDGLDGLLAGGRARALTAMPGRLRPRHRDTGRRRVPPLQHNGYINISSSGY